VEEKAQPGDENDPAKEKARKFSERAQNAKGKKDQKVADQKPTVTRAALKLLVEEAERDVQDADARLKSAKERLRRLKEAYEGARPGKQEKDHEGFTFWDNKLGGFIYEAARQGNQKKDEAEKQLQVKADDKAALQGTWQVVSIERHGQEQPWRKKKETWVIKDTRIASKPGRLVLSAVFTVRPDKTPKEIDINPDPIGPSLGEADINKGIYTLQGDVWKICLPRMLTFPGTEARPKEMLTKAGGQLVLITLKRVKPEQPVEKKPTEGTKDEGGKQPEAKADDAKDEPQAVYAADPTDPWNRMFSCLFTRTFKARLSDDFGESKRVVERTEYGDRAIEPLYLSATGEWNNRQGGVYLVVTEPLYSRFKKALDEALNERRQRPPLARALMQADVWAAHDILSRNYIFVGEEGKQRLDRRNELVRLLGQFVKKLALTPKEIKVLPDNYAAAVGVHDLPDLFGADSGWWEVRWSKERLHDAAADYRRVARVFIKPATSPKDRIKFLNGMRLGSNNHSKPSKQLEAVALLTQNLLIDSDGKVVPSPLTYEVQVRTFVKDKDGKLVRTESKQYELNRQKLLHDPKGGGFVEADDKVAVYLPSAGNNYRFASRPHGHDEPIMVRLGTRCAACHGRAVVFTFDMEPDESGALPPVTLLRPSDNEHARYVIGRKVEHKDFNALQERWKDRKEGPPDVGSHSTRPCAVQPSGK
jgi:uncharacterized protein (TIGR03067 family)